MKFYDVTAPIFPGMPVYKNKPEKQPALETVTNGYVTETRLSLDVHTGTHVDAPLHMISNGDTIETVAIEQLVRPVKVIDVTSAETAVSADHLQDANIEQGDFILFKTKNSWDEEFNFDFIYVDASAAKLLAQAGVVGVGIDALGIERAQEGHPTHKTLMEKEIIIMEGLRLKDVPAGDYFMVAAPLPLQGVDASPARVLLFTETPGA